MADETYSYDPSHRTKKDIVRAYIADKPNGDGRAVLSDEQINLALSENDDDILLARADCHDMLAAVAEREAYSYEVNMGAGTTKMDASETPGYHSSTSKELRERSKEK